MQSEFEKAYRAFHTTFRRERDPVGRVHLYHRKKDQEIVAFLAALLAYGNVQTILNSLDRVLSILGESPYDALRQKGHWPELNGFRHRFTSGAQLQALFYSLHFHLEKEDSLEKLFSRGPGNTLKDQLSFFVRQISNCAMEAKRLSAADRRSFHYLLSDPERGSACKRLNLFLRWVVRRADGIDLGLWSILEPKDLLLPVDTHILKTLKLLKWTDSKTANWKVAEAATARLRKLNPEDPIRYDFSLCHLSMQGLSLDSFSI